MDATFAKQESRDRVIKLAKETEANLFVFLVKCDEATIEERIKTGVVHQEITGSIIPPVRYDGDSSEAGIEVHRLVKEVFSPIIWEHTIIDGTELPSKIYLQINSILASSNPLFPTD